MLTIGDLRKMIDGMRDSDPLVMTRCSDFGPVEEGDVEVIEVVVQQGGAFYRKRYQGWDGKRDTLQPMERTVRALYFAGN